MWPKETFTKSFRGMGLAYVRCIFFCSYRRTNIIHSILKFDVWHIIEWIKRHSLADLIFDPLRIMKIAHTKTSTATICLAIQNQSIENAKTATITILNGIRKKNYFKTEKTLHIRLCLHRNRNQSEHSTKRPVFMSRFFLDWILGEKNCTFCIKQKRCSLENWEPKNNSLPGCLVECWRDI